MLLALVVAAALDNTGTAATVDASAALLASTRMPRYISPPLVRLAQVVRPLTLVPQVVDVHVVPTVLEARVCLAPPTRTRTPTLIVSHLAGRVQAERSQHLVPLLALAQLVPTTRLPCLGASAALLASTSPPTTTCPPLAHRAQAVSTSH
jgi:hypothetical protein